jgi:hypothetical protein
MTWLGLGGDGCQTSRRQGHLGLSGPGRWLLFDEPHLGGLGALLAFGNLELDGLALLQRALAGGFNRAEVDEDIRAPIDGDEAIALVRVEPLDGPSGHGVVPPSVKLGGYMANAGPEDGVG